MNRAFYRTEPTLQRTPGPPPRWVKPLVVSVIAAIGLMVVSRAVTVATMDDIGPPPVALAQADTP
jgi:hypothetical protein